MSLAELYPAVRALRHAEKIRLLQFLANELAREEQIPEFHGQTEFPVWSPFEAQEAARQLQELLHAGEGAP